MCHVSSALFGARSLERSDIAGRTVLEVGSHSVNGSLRPLLEAFGPREYVGTDIVSGPGVDLICDGCQLVDRFGADRFDVVVCTEVYEHVLDWQGLTHNLKRVVKPGGILLVTTRSEGFPYHAHPHDYWRYGVDDMRAIFADFDIEALESDPEMPGVFLKARRRASAPEPDLSQVALFSIIAGARRIRPDPSDYRSLRFRFEVLRQSTGESLRRLRRRVFPGV